MRRQLRKLFDALAVSHPLELAEASLETEFSRLLPVLNRARLLKPGEPCLDVVCPVLPNNCLVTAQPSNGRYYVHCECSEEAGLVKIDPKLLRRSRFDLPAFMRWLGKQAGVDADLREIEAGELWLLGEKTLRGETAKVYFSRLTSRKKVETLRQSLQKGEKPPIVFWLGKAVHKGHQPSDLISLPDTVGVSSQRLSFPRRLAEVVFSKRPATKGGDVVLDNHIAVHWEGKKCYLLMRKSKGAFEQKRSIRPQAGYLIEFLFQVRGLESRARTLADLGSRFSNGNKRTIDTRIKEINSLCREIGTKLIFQKAAGDLWGLNPALGCCE